MYKTLIFAGFERGHGRQSFPFIFFFFFLRETNSGTRTYHFCKRQTKDFLN